MRRNIVVGNWKMNLTRDDSFFLANDVVNKLSSEMITEIVFAPSFIHLSEVNKTCIHAPNVSVASQDCSVNQKGAFTGEVSASMIASYGAKYVILGHSERRANFSETNELLKLKVNQAFVNNLEVIFCCGESLEQRNGGVQFDWIRSQIFDSLFHLSLEEFAKIVIAYEPIWAIGTGVNANSAQVQEIHAFIRDIISKKYGDNIADNTSILYGGSCNPSNATELFSNEDVDGGLIGGASLIADDFLSIIHSF